MRMQLHIYIAHDPATQTKAIYAGCRGVCCSSCESWECGKLHLNTAVVAGSGTERAAANTKTQNNTAIDSMHRQRQNKDLPKYPNKRTCKLFLFSALLCASFGCVCAMITFIRLFNNSHIASAECTPLTCMWITCDFECSTLCRSVGPNELKQWHHNLHNDYNDDANVVI